MANNQTGDNGALVTLLNECTPGNLSPAVFDAVARVAVYPAIEALVYRLVDDTLEIGLLKRPEDDKFWPGMWHIPGTVLRPTDKSFEDAFQRLLKDEIPFADGVIPQLFSVNIVPYKRGTGLTLEHAFDYSAVNENGLLTFFNVNELPSGFIEEQKPIVDRLLKFLKSS